MTCSCSHNTIYLWSLGWKACTIYLNTYKLLTCYYPRPTLHDIDLKSSPLVQMQLDLWSFPRRAGENWSHCLPPSVWPSIALYCAHQIPVDTLCSKHTNRSPFCLILHLLSLIINKKKMLQVIKYVQWNLKLQAAQFMSNSRFELSLSHFFSF